MTSRDRTFLGIGLGIGAWAYPIGLYCAARISHRHFLSIDN